MSEDIVDIAEFIILEAFVDIDGDIPTDEELNNEIEFHASGYNGDEVLQEAKSQLADRLLKDGEFNLESELDDFMSGPEGIEDLQDEQVNECIREYLTEGGFSMKHADGFYEAIDKAVGKALYLWWKWRKEQCGD